MTFSGWPPSMLDFYARLEVDNSKEFFDANRAIYDGDVRGPMEALVEELGEEFGPAKIFRPNRDVRFSKDKRPYKTEVAAIFRSVDSGGLFVRADADGLAAGGGYYTMTSAQLQRFRQSAADDRRAAELRGLIDALGALDGMVVTSEELKTVPRGVPATHPHLDLLRRKNLVLMRGVDPGPLVHTAAALDLVRRTFREGAPLMRWLDAHVGPSAASAP